MITREALIGRTYMIYPILYRKRIIPSECILLKDDTILQCDESVVITSWKAFHPKPNLAYGYSCYYLHNNWKVSKFFRSDNSFAYWYCDIVDYEIDPEKNTILVTDLLADVIIEPDGSVRVVDLDELEDAFDRHLIDAALLKKSLLALNRLLTEIYANGVSNIKIPIEKAISQNQ